MVIRRFIVAWGLAMADTCQRNVEMVILQDASSSFMSVIAEMPPMADRLVRSMNERLETEVFVSMASFIDKALPQRGLGKGRGYPDVLDYCYSNEFSASLSTSVENLAVGYSYLVGHLGNGGDNPENMHEAMLYGALDPKFNWTSADEARNRKIIKVLLMVTDDLGHVEGDAWKEGIEYWNKQEHPSEDGYQFWDGNFGAKADFYDSQTQEPLYNEMLKLRNQKHLQPYEKKRFDDLYALLGPDEFPRPVEHSYEFEAHTRCEEYEYPNPAEVGKILKREGIVPIIALSARQGVRNDTFNDCKRFDPEHKSDYEKVATPELIKQCLMNSWKRWMEIYGVDYYGLTWFEPTANQLVDSIVETVDLVTSNVICGDTHPTLEPNSSSTELPLISTQLTRSHSNLRSTTTSTTVQTTTYAESPGATATKTDSLTDNSHTKFTLESHSITNVDPTTQPTTLKSTTVKQTREGHTFSSHLESEFTTSVPTEVSNTEYTTHDLVSGYQSKEYSTLSSRYIGRSSMTATKKIQTTSALSSTTEKHQFPNSTQHTPKTHALSATTANENSGSVGSTTTDEGAGMVTGENHSSDESIDYSSTTGGTSYNIPPVVPESQRKNSSKVEVVTGAAGGIAVGVASAAIAAYKHVWLGLLSGSGSRTPELEQIDNPDTPLERETIEEVTMEMFR